jgi:P4 family phage/plasmid primase-like protien
MSACVPSAPCGACDCAVETHATVKLADLLIPRLHGRFRWCKELGWLHFTGARWEPDAEPAALIAVGDTIKAYTRKLNDESARGLTKEQLRELFTFSSGSTMEKALKLARGAQGIITQVSAFDALPQPGSPWLVPCANGWTIELFADGQRKVRSTLPGDLNTRTACSYHPDDEAPHTEAALADYQPDPQVRAYLLQMWARGLSGMGMERFVVNLGEQGGNGKSTMQGVLEAVGGDYAVELPVEAILKGRISARSEFRSELAAMRGARLVFCDEPGQGAAYDLGTLKKITGGNSLQGRSMGKDAVTFQPRVLFQMASNSRPSWSADGGMKRRYIELSWDYVVDPGQLRESFKEDLKTEASGFLNLVLDHWTGSAPLAMPEAVRRQSEAGEVASSPVAQFMQDAIEQEKNAPTVKATKLYAAYKEWARNSNERAVPQRKFGIEMVRLGAERDHNRYGTVYLNIRLHPDYEPHTDSRQA